MVSEQLFCVVTQPRTGSEYLTTLLNDHRQIACHRELYNRHHIVHILSADVGSQFASIEDRNADRLAFLDRMMAATRLCYPEKPCLGFKLFLTHAAEVIDRVIEDERWKIILLERRNKLAQYTSLRIAEETAIWNSFVGESRAGQHSVHVHVGDLDAYIKSETELYRNFHSRIAGRPDVYMIASENIDDSIRGVIEFVGADWCCNLRSKRGRQNSSNLMSRIKNWDEVHRYLSEKGLDFCV